MTPQREVTAEAMRALGIPESWRFFAILAEEQARVALESGVTLSDLRAVVEFCAKLIAAGDASPNIKNARRS